MERNLNFDSNSRISIYLLFLIIAIFVTLISISLSSMQFAVGADEGYYLKYATSIAESGFGGFKGLFKEYIETPRYWVFPNPLRIGFIIIASIWLKVFGFGYSNLAHLSLFSSCLLLLVSFYYSKKYFGVKFAILLTLFVAFSPLVMALSRRALMDSTSNLFSLSTIWIFYDYINSRSRLKLLLFLVVFVIAILIKETSVLLTPIFFVYLLSRRLIFNKEINLGDFIYSSIVPFFLVGLVYVSLGIMPYFWQVVNIILNSPKTNPYALDFGRGPWFRYLIDYMLISPFILILAIGYFFYRLTNKIGDDASFYFSLVFITLFLVYEFFTKNVRYVMLLDYPIRIFALLMLVRICDRFFEKKIFLLTILVIVIVFFDYVSFYTLFVQEGIYDPVSFWLLKVNQIIP